MLFGAGVAVFDTLDTAVRCGPGTGLANIRFGLGAVLPNLRLMPSHLIEAMPMLVLGFAALIGIGALGRVAAIGRGAAARSPVTTPRSRRYQAASTRHGTPRSAWHSAGPG